MKEILEKTIFGVSSLNFLLNLVSILTPWVMFSATTPSQRVFNQLIPGTTNTGVLNLYNSVACITKDDVMTNNEIQSSCIMIMTSYFPEAIKYIKYASNTAIIFTSISVPVTFITLIISYLRVYNSYL
jgi:hypothetical protein